MMFLKILWTLLVIYSALSFYLSTTTAWRLYKFDFTYIQGNGSSFISLNASIGNHSNGHAVVGGYFLPKMKIVATFYMKGSFSTVSKNVNLPIKLVRSAEVCELFKNPNLPPIVIGVYKALTTRTNMPLKCPIDTKEYHMLGIGDNEEDYPPYLPLGSYKVELEGYRQRKKSLITIFTLLVRMSVIKNNDKRPTRARRVKHYQFVGNN